MITKIFMWISYCIFAFVATTNLLAQASDPLVGTWELNIEKSKFSPLPPPKSQTRTYEVTGQQEKMIAKGVDPKGNPTLQQFSANRDGMDYPYEGGPPAGTISITPVDSFTATYTVKAGKEVNHTGTRVISKDGKMMTISVKFIDPKGQGVDILMVFDKR